MLFGFISGLRLRALPTLKTVVVIKFCSGLVLFGSETSAQESSSSRIEELTISATRQPRTIENIAGTAPLITYPIGRNVDEMLRLVDALQFSEEHGEVCPAGWEKGDSGMKATTEGVAEYLAENSAKL